MACSIDFSMLGVRAALDFAIMVEEDALLRYQQLAQVIGDDPAGAGDVCRMMVVNERKHRLELEARRAALVPDGPPPIEVSILDAGVERPDVDDGMPRTARAALEMSLSAERRAQAFYRDAAAAARDGDVRALFEDLMREEEEHAALLARKLEAVEAEAPLAAEVMPCAVEVPPPAPVPSFPDGASLATVLPRFDAATQAVARSVIVDGLAPAEVARALGVTRNTVVRKLNRFVALARQQLAVAVAATALAGCGGGMDLAGGGPALQPEARPAAVAEAQAQAQGPAFGQAPAALEGSAAAQPSGQGAPEAVEGGSQGLSRTPPVAQVQADGRVQKPELANVSPASGGAEGGEEILITGSGFASVQVMIGSSVARVTSQSSNAVTIIAPAGAAGTHPVVVTNRDGTYAVAGNAYTYRGG